MSIAADVIELNIKNKTKTRSKIYEWIRFGILLGMIFFIFRFAIGFVVINGDSMNPTLDDGNFVITSNIFYEIERYDVVVVQDEYGFDIIKRVIAMPGEIVSIKDNVIFVNGEALTEGYTTGFSNDMEEIVVEEGKYFIVGDNREPGESLDSRSSDVGTVYKKLVKGQAVFSLMSLKLL